MKCTAAHSRRTHILQRLHYTTKYKQNHPSKYFKIRMSGRFYERYLHAAIQYIEHYSKTTHKQKASTTQWWRGYIYKIYGVFSFQLFRRSAWSWSFAARQLQIINHTHPHRIIFLRHLCSQVPDFVKVIEADHITSNLPLPVSFFLLPLMFLNSSPVSREGTLGVMGCWWTQ